MKKFLLICLCLLILAGLVLVAIWLIPQQSEDAGVDTKTEQSPEPQETVVAIQPVHTQVPAGEEPSPIPQNTPSAEQPLSSGEDISNLEYAQELFQAIPHDFQLDISIVEGKETFAEGEKLSFAFQSSRDTHVAIFNHQVDGSIVILFPNAWDQQTFIRANTIYYIPNREKGTDYTVTVGPPFGDDVVQIIGCTQANEFHTLIQEIAGQNRSNIPFTGTSRSVVTGGVTRAVQQGLSSADGTIQWSETSIILHTHP